MIPFISEERVRKLLDEKKALRLARETFRLIGLGRTRMPPKLYLNMPHRPFGDFRAMPAFVDSGLKPACGIKWISVFPENRRRGLPTVMGDILLNSSQTGRPLALIEANTLTAMRTGAVSALASTLLSNPRPRKLALVGAGLQAAYQLKAHTSVYRFKEISVWGHERGEADRFCRRFRRLCASMTPARTVEACVRDADIVITCTASRKPLVRKDWLKTGVHINAIGADARGKQELDPAVLKNAKVVVDEWEQARHSGEINVPYAKGLFKERHLYAELAEIVSGRRKGRTRTSERTVFDSTGLAVLDIFFAQSVYHAHRRPS